MQTVGLARIRSSPSRTTLSVCRSPDTPNLRGHPASGCRALQLGAGPHQADPEAHGLIAHLKEQPGPGRGLLPDDPHPLGVATPAFLLDADVHTEQVARLQRDLAGLAAEGDLVVSNRDAGVLAGVVARQVLTIDVRVVLVDDEVVGDVVDVLRRGTGFDVRGEFDSICAQILPASCIMAIWSGVLIEIRLW
jgi:hypothetical protein